MTYKLPFFIQFCILHEQLSKLESNLDDMLWDPRSLQASLRTSIHALRNCFVQPRILHLRLNSSSAGRTMPPGSHSDFKTRCFTCCFAWQRWIGVDGSGRLPGTQHLALTLAINDGHPNLCKNALQLLSLRCVMSRQSVGIYLTVCNIAR